MHAFFWMAQTQNTPDAQQLMHACRTGQQRQPHAPPTWCSSFCASSSACMAPSISPCTPMYCSTLWNILSARLWLSGLCFSRLTGRLSSLNSSSSSSCRFSGVAGVSDAEGLGLRPKLRKRPILGPPLRRAWLNASSCGRRDGEGGRSSKAHGRGQAQRPCAAAPLAALQVGCGDRPPGSAQSGCPAPPAAGCAHR